MIYNNSEIKKLGFGFMRLPVCNNEIDIEKTKEMVDEFLANGFTYFDTAYGYHSQKSELAINETLVKRHPRDSFILATKLPAWSGAKTAEEAKAMFDTSLERTGAGYFDFYLLHNMGGVRTKVFEDFGIWEFLIEKKAKGLIKKLGFSFHGDAVSLEEILSKRSDVVDFVQLQINYADWFDNTVQSKKCYEVARKYGKEIIVMEPIRGGALINPPKAVKDVFDNSGIEQNMAAWALRYSASFEGVITVLSGMSSMEQLTENIATFKNFKPMTEGEQQVIAKAQEEFAKIKSIPCTNCRYCVKDCPAGIDIPMILAAMNSKLVYDDLNRAKGQYSFALKNGNAPESCVNCGQCEEACPQYIEIIKELGVIAETLG